MNTQVYERDSEGFSRVFGVKVEAVSAVFVVLVGMIAYGGPIIAGTIYLQNIYNGLEQVRTSIVRLQAGPEAISELKARMQRVEDVQAKIAAGETGPQNVVREQIKFIFDAIKECRGRGDEFNNESKRSEETLTGPLGTPAMAESEIIAHATVLVMLALSVAFVWLIAEHMDPPDTTKRPR